MRRLGDRLVAVAAVLLVVGPLAHLAMHAPDHSHLPGGVVVRHGLQQSGLQQSGGQQSGWQRSGVQRSGWQRSGVQPPARGPLHDHPHPSGAAHAHDHPHDAPGDDDPADDPLHGAGSLAHLAGALVLAAPVLVPPRRVRVHRPRWVAEMPSPPLLRGRAVHAGWRARAPPVPSFGSISPI